MLRHVVTYSTRHCCSFCRWRALTTLLQAAAPSVPGCPSVLQRLWPLVPLPAKVGDKARQRQPGQAATVLAAVWWLPHTSVLLTGVQCCTSLSLKSSSHRWLPQSCSCLLHCRPAGRGLAGHSRRRSPQACTSLIPSPHNLQDWRA